MGPFVHRSVRATALALLLVGPFSAAAQQSPSSTEKTRLFSDSATAVTGPAVLSPDGKWVVFPVMTSPAKANLAVVRVGGEGIQPLTSAGSWDQNPEWSPSGDRIYFLSNRAAAAGDQLYYGMEVRFDPATGRAIGEPRRISPDPVQGFIRVSPDGKMLAFVDGTDRRQLKVVPASGGEMRVVARMPLRSGNIAWSGDGQHLYFLTNVAPQSERVLYRVPAAGGEIVAVSNRLPPAGQLLIGPGAEVFVVSENADGPRNRLLKLYDQSGTLVRTIPVNRNTRATQVTRDGALVVVETDVVAPTRIMPIEGGAYRDVTAPVAYDWVMRWSADGKTLYTWTEQDGTAVLAAVPVDGGTPRTFPETPEWGAEGANSRFLFQASRREGNNPRSLVALDLRDGSRHVITESAPGHNMLLPYGPGGTWGAHEELYFLERRGDWLDVKGWRGPGEVRTLHSLPASLLGRTNFAVHGNRVAWQQERGDSVDLMIADGEKAEHRRLLTIYAMPGTNEISFSNDGKLLALHYSRGPGSPDLMAFVDPSGAAVPRIVDTGLSYWYWPRWMPDDSGVLVVGGGAGAEAHIVRIPVAEGAPPVNITQSDPASKWGFEVSPDGRYIAYPGEIWKGSLIWRISNR
ncbi:MAG: hypothetical protein NUW01_05400 [Gemmatimonadaceae bacterium]|nr:hypothetical protein [Gemmatimonadaceae bacterium]